MNIMTGAFVVANQLLQTTLRPGLKLQSLYYLMGGSRKTKSEVWGNHRQSTVSYVDIFSTLFILYIYYI